MRLPRLVRSAGFRFAALHTLIFVVSVAIIGWIAETAVTSALEQQAHQRVDAEASELVAEHQRAGWTAFLSTVEARIAAHQRRLRYVVLDREGQTAAGDARLAPYAAPAGAPAETATRPSKGSSESILVATRPLNGGARLVVVDGLESIEDVEDVVSNAFMIALGVAAVLGLGAGSLLANALLKRVDAVTRTAEAITAGDLGRRIELTGAGDDFDRLSAALNAMLDRISGLLENLKQVTNDIAHDLRTPLSRLRQGLEDAKARIGTAKDHDEAIDRAVKEADGLLETFSALLRIAQIEAGARQSAFHAVDLSDAMRTIAEAYGPAVEDGGRMLQAEIAEGVRVDGDRELLVQLFANLVENAIHHTPPGTTIQMRLADDVTGPTAEVADNGSGIPEAERSKVFRRFYRLERSRTTPGNGLGLSMVAAIADLHHAAIAPRDNQPGFRVRVRFPARQRGPEGARAAPMSAADIAATVRQA